MNRSEYRELDKVRSTLNRLKENARRLKGTNKVAMKTLFNPGFMRRNTKYSSFDEMVGQSPFQVQTVEDFKAIPDKEWDAFISKNTRFSGWRQMLQSASAEMIKKELFR